MLRRMGLELGKLNLARRSWLTVTGGVRADNWSEGRFGDRWLTFLGLRQTKAEQNRKENDSLRSSSIALAAGVGAAAGAYALGQWKAQSTHSGAGRAGRRPTDIWHTLRQLRRWREKARVIQLQALYRLSLLVYDSQTQWSLLANGCRYLQANAIVRSGKGIRSLNGTRCHLRIDASSAGANFLQRAEHTQLDTPSFLHEFRGISLLRPRGQIHDRRNSYQADTDARPGQPITKSDEVCLVRHTAISVGHQNDCISETEPVFSAF